MQKTLFIASPLFNPFQHGIIGRIEDLCIAKGIEFYSARKDSEPFVPKGEDKKNPDAWDKVFQNNEEGLQACHIMIAVLGYALPENQKFGLATGVDHSFEHGVRMADFKHVEIPDSGTVWEMGYFRALGKPVIGFHPTRRADDINLMLTHGCDGLISGWDSLTDFFTERVAFDYDSIPSRLWSFPKELLGSEEERIRETATQFDWNAVERWGAQNGEVAT
jgi:nucleoside 2-deoxyribosyltransferase